MAVQPQDAILALQPVLVRLAAARMPAGRIVVATAGHGVADAGILGRRPVIHVPVAEARRPPRPLPVERRLARHADEEAHLPLQHL